MKDVASKDFGAIGAYIALDFRIKNFEFVEFSQVTINLGDLNSINDVFSSTMRRTLSF